ncbi:MAG: primosomal protein N' [Elusimicrobiales bacterium]|nr:primosomal protein N' [Elusimicrobiales bacterium]
MLAEVIFPIPLKRSFHYALPEDMELVAAPGLRVSVSLGTKNSVGIILSVLAEKDADLSGIKRLKSIKKLIDSEPLFEESVLEIAKFMEKKWGSSLGMCAGEFFLNIPECQENNSLLRFSEHNLPQPDTILSLPDDCFFPEKEKAFLETELYALSPFFDSINDISSKKKKNFLLALPSEKTIVLAGLVAKKAKNIQILFLVPDAECANRAYKELLPFFGSALGVWHSMLTQKKKNEIIKKIISGQIRLLIGTRTAVFLPFARLRIAIIDSFHEAAYRNEEREPLYDASEVLMRRIDALGGINAMVSQFPSVESYGLAKSGKCHFINIASDASDNENRISPALEKKKETENTNSKIKIVDMGTESFQGALLSSSISGKIRSIALAGKKIAVIASRKGYVSRIFCASCGKMLRCPKCGPGLALIKNPSGEKILLCRHCGRKLPMPDKCHCCGGNVFREFGIGTQKAETYLKKLVPEKKIVRYDGDILKASSKKIEETLHSFLLGKSDILIATRLALRSLIPQSLDCILFLDAGADFSSPDFRASEKFMRMVLYAKELLSPNGEILLQTREPDSYIFTSLAHGSYYDFCDEELKARQFFKYPPYSQLLLVRFASVNEAAVKTCGKRLNAAMRAVCDEKKAELQGPVIPKGQENRKFFSEYWILKSFTDKAASDSLEIANSLPLPDGVKFFIVPDPYHFP